ncbi:MAG: EamA family transporter [Nocardioidaceae bacterium]
MAVLLALFSAIAYGLSDFVGGIVSRRTTAWSVAVLGNASSSLLLVGLASLQPGSPTGTDFAWAVLAGLGGGTGTGFLYRGFASGRMSVVAPVSAVGAAVVPVLVGVATGERPDLVVWTGIVAAMPGIWLVSSTPDSPMAGDTAGREGRLPPGLVDALLAGLGFGVLFAALGQVPAGSGLWPLAVSQLVSVPSVVGLAVLLRGAWVPRGRWVLWAVLAGTLGATATLTFLLASQRGYLTVSGVLASLYPATTVLLAASVLREHIHRAQGVGLGLCALAVVLVAAG